jgi:predicted phosphohydrolase
MKYFSIACFLLIVSLGFSQGKNTVYLVGDAGEDTIPGAALRLLKEQLLKDTQSTVIFLGDNVYPNGLVKNSRVSQKHLESQLQLLNDFPGQAYFVPGNHDWDAQKKTGLAKLKDEQDYVEAYMKSKTIVANRNSGTFYPADGLPGPVSVMLSPTLRLLMFDSQWFLQFYKKNKIVSKKYTKELFYQRLDSLLAFSKANHEQVILAAHHPMYTNGQHSKSRQPWRFLVNRTPFQLFGLLGLNRLYSQDIAQPRYKKMRNKMLDILTKYDNVTYVSGHDHNLQCFKEGKTRYLVSGSGSKLSPLSRRKKFKAVFEDDSKTGFIRLEYTEAGKPVTTVFRAGEKEVVLPDY